MCEGGGTGEGGRKKATCSAGKRLARYMTPGDQLLKALIRTLAASQQLSACMPVPTRHRQMCARLRGSSFFCWYTLIIKPKWRWQVLIGLGTDR